jgi:hypothetical protein
VLGLDSAAPTVDNQERILARVLYVAPCKVKIQSYDCFAIVSGIRISRQAITALELNEKEDFCLDWE